MSDGLFAAVELGTPPRAGFRLQRVEVFNWGTFDKRVWRLSPSGSTALLTGDIGSGKSTLVDALTTLLLPAHRISYNKAAGADAKERTLRSYVEGHYKSERVESTGTSRPVGLRDERHYSVVLGVFANDGYGETVTLGQVFHQRDRSGQPDRFFVTSAKELTIESDFTAFGTDLADLRRRLRAAGSEIHTAFPDYGRALRRLLGIRSEQAMELFHQTVSMKSVGNLNEFVRNHMLEPVDASSRVRDIVTHFEDLTKAHDAVKRARDQLETLTPVVSAADNYDSALARRQHLEQQRDAVRLYVAELRVRLLVTEIAAHEAVRTARAREAADVEQALNAVGREREQLIRQHAAAGFDRVSQLGDEAAAARVQAAERRGRRGDFDQRVQAAGLDPVPGELAFAAVAQRLPVVREELAARQKTLGLEQDLSAAERSDLRRQGEETRAELTSLAGRTSNLPSGQLELRAQLCADLGIEEAELPFAGELLDITEEHSEWRGAAERVLRGFALSLLVPQLHYAQVARWVNSRRLTHRRNDGRTVGSRLVYERVAVRRVPLQARAGSGGLMLANTVQVKPGPFADYLRDQLTRRADYRCVDTIEEFRDETRAVTREGQVRTGDRHEKDDRSRVDDPRSWVLGWVNERKIAALTEQMLQQQTALLTADQRHADLQRSTAAVHAQITALAAVELFRSWTELDWSEAETRADAADAERARLIAGSSALAEIAQRLSTNTERGNDLKLRLDNLNGDMRVEQDRIDRAQKECDHDEAFIREQHVELLTAARGEYAALEERLGDSLPTSAGACRAAADTLTTDLHAGIERLGRQLNGYATNLVQQMSEIRRRWPEATTEMDASVDARNEYRAFHERVATDDLPRFESEFKRQLNTNTIRELAQFNNWLRRQSDEIHTRVARINEALGAIDYSAGRYITLVAERTVNQEVQEFRAELRSATDDTLAPDDDHYSEQRFLDVQRIIERLRGRDGHAESDRAWTRRVTDVRNWFTFSASERDRATDEEWEHYRDSDGKSGGQKEKLAYTILAASLAYQFGLEWGAQQSRDFRFAVIDEAFGRGSDVSTRYALDLFARLGLQLLIVTPLQKVHVIEPYVEAIGFVDNPTGSYSRLQTLTIEEFRARQSDQTA